MQARISRRKLAVYAANRVQDGVLKQEVLQELAAYLAETRRLREAPLLVREIEDVLEARGVVVADVVTAHGLDAEARKMIDSQLGGDETYLREKVDPAVLGGVRIKTPSASYDATLAHKLMKLRGAKL